MLWGTLYVGTTSNQQKSGADGHWGGIEVFVDNLIYFEYTKSHLICILPCCKKKGICVDSFFISVLVCIGFTKINLTQNHN